MKNNKERLFEVMGRLDKTFKPTLNENFEEIETTDDVEIPAETGEEVPSEEKSDAEKIQELTVKVDELYALLHDTEEVADELPAEIEVETGEVENLQEWNFDKKKGEKEDSEGDGETPAEEKEEEIDETKKIPVEAIAKVGK